jgi:hypothetical protein
VEESKKREISAVATATSNKHHVVSHQVRQVAAPEAVPDRGHVQRVYVYADREIRFLYGQPKIKGLAFLFNQAADIFLLSPVLGSVVFLIFSLTFIATILYLPHHTVFLLNRAWFYVNGDSVDVLEMTKEAVQELAQGAGLHAAAAAGTTTTVEAVRKAAETLVKGEL